MSSVRQTKYGRSSYRLGREQIMLAKMKLEEFRVFHFHLSTFH